jgi:hypothetical protein
MELFLYGLRAWLGGLWMLSVPLAIVFAGGLLELAILVALDLRKAACR